MLILSATDRSGSTDSSWNTLTMPTALAACGVSNFTGLPSKIISPSSGATTPEMILMSVDLPAPFSPSTAWIDRALVAKSTFDIAATPP